VDAWYKRFFPIQAIPLSLKLYLLFSDSIGLLSDKMAEALVGILSIFLMATLSQSEGSYRPIAPNPENQCQPLSISTCTVLGYGTTRFPNFRNHQTQTEAKKEMDSFEQLIHVNCSVYTRMFLCGYYLPFCVPNPRGDDVFINPCKKLCENVRDGCTNILQRAGYAWPSFFDCSLGSFSDGPVCFGPPELQAISTAAPASSSSARTESTSSTSEIEMITSEEETSLNTTAATREAVPFTKIFTAIVDQDGLTLPEGSDPKDIEQTTSSVTVFPTFKTDPAEVEISSSQELLPVLWPSVLSVVLAFI